MSKETARNLLSPYADKLLKVVKAADVESSCLGFPITKRTRANIRYDAMRAKAIEVFEGVFQPHDAYHTTMWIGDHFILHFKKVDSNGSVGGYPTERAKSLKESGQLGLFPAGEDNSSVELPVFMVGYQSDNDSAEILAYLISLYSGGSPAWVMGLEELISQEVEVDYSDSAPTERVHSGTQIRIKDSVIRKKNNEGSFEQ